MKNRITKEEKWYKPYDPFVWVGLWIVLLTVVTYHGDINNYEDEKIPFNKDITTIEEAINETDKIIKDKYGDKYELYSINGYAYNIHAGEIQPDLQLSYLKVKGLTRKRIDYNVSLEQDEIVFMYSSSNIFLEKEVNFDYNPSKLDLDHILKMVESKVDMEKVKSGYEPYFIFNTYDNDMNVEVGYYKKMKNHGPDYDSKVSYRFVINVKNQDIESESTKGL